MRVSVALLIILLAGCAHRPPNGTVVFPMQPGSDGGGSGSGGGGGGGMGM